MADSLDTTDSARKQVDEAYSDLLVKEPAFEDLTNCHILKKWYENNATIHPNYRSIPYGSQIVAKLNQMTVKRLHVDLSHELLDILDFIENTPGGISLYTIFGDPNDLASIDRKAILPFDLDHVETLLDNALRHNLTPLEYAAYPAKLVSRIFLDRVEENLKRELAHANNNNKQGNVEFLLVPKSPDADRM